MVQSGEHSHPTLVSYATFRGDLNDMSVRIQRLSDTINALGDRLDDEVGGRLGDQERRIAALEQAKTDGEPFRRWKVHQADSACYPVVKFDGGSPGYAFVFSERAHAMVALLNANRVIP